VRASETACPFCKGVVDGAPPISNHHVSRRAVLFAAGLTLAGCSGAVRYGGPPRYQPPPEDQEQQQEQPPPEQTKDR
jgi:hypothetical protein